MCKRKEFITNKAMLLFRVYTLREHLQRKLDIDGTIIEMHILLF